MRSANNARPGLDDLMNLMSGAAGGVSGLYDELKLAWRSRFEEIIGTLDYVPRADFEALQAVVAELSKRVDALEGKSVVKTPKAAKPASAAKSTSTKAKAETTAGKTGAKRARPKESTP